MIIIQARGLIGWLVFGWLVGWFVACGWLVGSFVICAAVGTCVKDLHGFEKHDAVEYAIATT